MMKNATLRMVWEPEDYPSVDMEFTVDEDTPLEDFIDYFKRFLFAVSFPNTLIEKRLSDD